MNPFIVLHHYPCQKTDVNVSMSLIRYITHPTGAGPRGPQAHTDALLGQGYCWLAHAISFDSIAYHSCYQTGKGHYDCFTITILKKKKQFYSLSPPPMTHGFPSHPPPPPLLPTLLCVLLLLTEYINHKNIMKMCPYFNTYT